MPLPDRPDTTQVVVEVTDTLSIGFTTGIQRVLREVLKGLDGPAGAGLQVVPVVTPSVGADFRRLTPEEAERLRVHPAGGRAGRRADDFGPLSPLVRRIGDLPLTLRVRAALAAARRRRIEFMPDHHELSLGPLDDGAIPAGSVFADLEGAWYDPTPRSQLLPALRRADVHTMVLVHDVMPLLFPQWFTAPHVQVFRDWLRAHLEHSELFLANSQCTAADLRRVAGTLGVQRSLDIRVVPLGADHPAVAPRPVPEVQGLGRYLLVVGTLEPRKNQQIVLDAFERLAPEHPDLGLVLVGKEGWLVDSLVQRLRHHPMREDRVRWLGGVDDEQLGWLYDHAFLTIAPSVYEGLGVPVLEAMHHGCATLASSGGAQPEAAAGVAELFEPDDLDGLVALVRRHLDDPEHHDAARAAAAAHRAPSWADTATVVAASIRELAQVVS
jgi:glycosyltransferase involved in cell wall biosynthesis